MVSQVALEPKTYRLEYAAADGSHGDVSLLGVDLPNDLAIIRLDKQRTTFVHAQRLFRGETGKAPTVGLGS
jgi:serine protease Do